MCRGLGSAVAVALVAFLLPAQTALPSAADLIHAAIAARTAQEKRGWKYTWREDERESDLDRDGRPLPPNYRKTYDVVMLEGEAYHKLILIDDKPLDAATERRIDDDLERERAARRSGRSTSVTRSLAVGELEDLERLFDNRLAGIETVLGREAWRVESEPRRGYKPAGKDEAEVMSAHRVTWFDRVEGVELAHRYTLFRAANGFQSGSWFDQQYARVGDEWQPAEDTIHFDMKVALRGHGRGELRFRYSEYKRFAVDTRMTPP